MRAIPDPGFAGDDGAVAPEVAEALAAYDANPDARHGATLALLQHARVLVPVVAMLGESEIDEAGRTHDKTSDMATVLMRRADGRAALLAFTGMDAMQRWDPAARPVPVRLPDAARAALHDGADALLLDVAGPVMVVIEGTDLRSLADGFVLADVAGKLVWVKAT